MGKLKRSIRICETCSTEFEIRDCYLKRSYKNGRFCSNACRNIGFKGTGNPNAGLYARYGSKVSQHKRQLEHYTKLRTLALDKLARVWESEIVCIMCGCNFIPLLQINHRKDFKTKQSGVSLYRIVLQLSDLEAKDKFDIRCSLCNWKHFLERKYDIQYNIEWREKVLNEI